MDIQTFRAKTMPQALALVRSELGPEATILHTREINASLLARFFFGRQYEIAATPSARKEQEAAPNNYANLVSSSMYGRRASTSTIADEVHDSAPTVPVPSRGTEHRARSTQSRPSARGAVREATGRGDAPGTRAATAIATAYRNDSGVELDFAPAPNPQSAIRNSQSSDLAQFQSLVAQLKNRAPAPRREMPAALFDVFTDLIEADVEEQSARELIDRLGAEPHLDLFDPLAARARLAHMLEGELQTSGPIAVTPGAGRVVALVGPTGVGKTTTIAKLAANFRLRENRRVGLITVDTYRIAAVEQLRTYADIIDLPMEVVGTPREMREAVQRMRTFDLVLMDTAGRSPRDEVRIQELRSMMAEASPDEVHLVLSAAASARSLTSAAEKFAPVGVTSLLVTKLDEATGFGNVLSLTRAAQLPVSYLTDGQNVPDDIAIANSKRLAQLILNISS